LETPSACGGVIHFEAHVMVEEPWRILSRWLAARKIFRIILHWEANGVKANIADLSREIRARGKEFGLALNPDTPISVLDNLIGEIDLALLMGVCPGFGGQTMKPEVISKIMALRQKQPEVKIEVDGGVKPQNILKLTEAGADFLVMGSAIFADPDPQAVIKQTYKMINL